MFTAKEYREKADHCRRLARDLDAQSRASLETLAKEYDTAASVVTRRTKVGMSAFEGIPELEPVE